MSTPRLAKLSAVALWTFTTIGFTACTPARSAEAKNLVIYFIDVEGGQSTLIVTPRGESLLIDTGFAGNGSSDFRPGDPHKARDANRIADAARDAGVKQIDELMITHFHPDHDGGVAELSELMPIRAFIDHGAPTPEVESGSAVIRNSFRTYVAARSKGTHLEPRPGDRLPLDGVEAVVVSSAGATLQEPLAGAGAANAACRDPAIPALDPDENPRSTGIVLRYGKFRFLDVGDLSGAPLRSLACPRDLIGSVDVYLVAHHGGPDVSDSATFAAFRPRVSILNNGLSKGGARATYELLHNAGLETWQLHRSASAAERNFPDPFVANLDEKTSYWIKLVAHEDGSFEVLNQRTSEWKRYGVHAK